MTERLSSWDQHHVTKRGTWPDNRVKVYEKWANGGWCIILSDTTIPLQMLSADNVRYRRLYGAHSYMLAQFVASPTNKRTDDYGRTLENRARIIYELIEAIKAAMNNPTFYNGIKPYAFDFQEGGIQPDEAVQVCG
ncbi:FMN-linked oxidoreductase [Tilletiaria anomala UBC 951]|uniref:FMN-linked oxidoreductase n=1 Tax=Tilletiaria anomala (strain ATCC 24038 / CBS 436.72 / UBC 951) TaxID=1037660 RepID=A0A066VXT8_TILAU|nr:FMN-linked oxidoreductase [Tilletiaria anomala UBC 951]KDN45108.1 FMN-linked oxidoreductase [Tilletiaria anomala UBC 951]